MKSLEWITGVVCFIAILYFGLGVLLATPEPVKTGAAVYEPWGKKEYHRLLRKHGLHKQISVLEIDWKGNTFFKRDGKRIKFQ